MKLGQLRDFASNFGFYPLPNGGDPPHLQFPSIVKLTKANAEYLALIRRNQNSYKDLVWLYKKYFNPNAPLLKNSRTREAALRVQAMFLNSIYKHEKEGGGCFPGYPPRPKR
jgi:hypothetical protein